MSIEKVIELATAACVYVPFNDEAMRIDAVVVEDGHFLGTGEDTGEQYQVEFTDVNLNDDMFYHMVLLNNK